MKGIVEDIHMSTKGMAKNILIAMDVSESSLKIIEYAARTIEKGASVTLYHVFLKSPHEPVTDKDYLPHHTVSFSGSTREFFEWLKQKRMDAEQMLEKARGQLVAAGISAADITVKIDENKRGIAEDILNELSEGNYNSLIIGKGNHPRLMRIIKKGIVDKIINHTGDCKVLIVD